MHLKSTNFCHNKPMTNWKKRLLWDIYLLFIFFLAIQKSTDFFSPETSIYHYFYFLYSFDKLFYIYYLINALQIIINLAGCIPVFLWIHRIKFLQPNLWRIFFILTVSFDLIGQSYDRIVILSFLRNDRLIAILMILQYFLIHVPFYVILFEYGFKWKNIFAKKND